MVDRRVGGINTTDRRVGGSGGPEYSGVTLIPVPVVSIPNLAAGAVTGPGHLVLTIGYRDNRTGTSNQFSINAG